MVLFGTNQSAMPNHFKSMNEIKQVLRLHFERGLAIKSISRELGMSKNTVKEYLRRFAASGVSLEHILKQEASSLSSVLRPEHATITSRYSAFLERADYYLKELKQHKHLTKQLLWEEEFTQGRIQYRYSQFCYYLQQYEQTRSSSMVLQFNPGDKLLVDFAGDKLYLTDPDSGKLTPCEILILTLAYSHKSFAVALPSQRLEDLLYGLTTGLEWLGAVPQGLVCDNMRAAVKRSDRYEPEVNEGLLDLANYYGMSVLPTRVRKPKDKSRVESSVNHVYYQVYARMRHHTYYSLEELNQALGSYCHEFNQQIMKDYGLSREALYQRDELQYMKALPDVPYQLVKRYTLKVGQNGHVYLGTQKQHYSVPYRLVGQKVHVVVTRSLLKIYYKSECVATHPVTAKRYNTVADHMASEHQAYLESINPQWLVAQARRIGQDTEKAIVHVLSRAKHPEQNYKTCQGILSLEKKHGASRLNKVCAFVLEADAVSYNYIKRLCESVHFGTSLNYTQTQLPLHANIRGPEGYQ